MADADSQRGFGPRRHPPLVSRLRGRGEPLRSLVVGRRGRVTSATEEGVGMTHPNELESQFSMWRQPTVLTPALGIRRVPPSG